MYRAVVPKVASLCVLMTMSTYRDPASTKGSDPSASSGGKRPECGKGTSNRAAMVGGTAVVLGAAVGLMAFGSVSATDSNLSVSSALHAIAQGAFDADGFGTMGNAAAAMTDALTDGAATNAVVMCVAVCAQCWMERGPRGRRSSPPRRPWQIPVMRRYVSAH